MIKKIFVFTALIILIMPAVVLAGSGKTSNNISGRVVMEKVQKESSPKTTHAAVQLDIIEKNGTQKTRLLEMWMEKDKKGLNRTLIIFRKPSAVKDTRFLIIQNKDRPDDQHIYLPALRRVRRISASARNKSFMGTEFTYEVMSTRNTDDDTHTILREENYNGYKCYVIESVPKTKGAYHYSKTVKWVAKDKWIILKVEMYSTDGKLKKVLTMSGYKKINGYWTPYKTTMKNVQSGRSTVLTNLKIEYDKKLSPKLFTVQFLKRGKLN